MMPIDPRICTIDRPTGCFFGGGLILPSAELAAKLCSPAVAADGIHNNPETMSFETCREESRLVECAAWGECPKLNADTPAVPPWAMNIADKSQTRRKPTKP